VKIATLLFSIVLSASSAYTQMGPVRVPAGIRQADKTEDQTQRNIPPPINQPTPLDLAKLQQDADQLAGLAQSIPADMGKVSQGMLPKDLIDKLKQVEKLSKHLRNELSH